MSRCKREALARGTIDVAWLGRALGRDVESAAFRAQDKMGGMSGVIKYLDVAFVDGTTQHLVVKLAPQQLPESRVFLGVAREAFFYAELAPALGDYVGNAAYTWGDLASGDMLLLLHEHEDAVPAGLFYGRGNPNNWKLSESSIVTLGTAVGSPTAVECSAACFSIYAKLHAAHWNDRVLLRSKMWLRGSDWLLLHEGRSAWEACQAMAAGGWASAKATIAAGTGTLRWDPHVIACLDASLAQVSWDAFIAQAAARPFALVQGDAHPHNALWVSGAAPAGAAGAASSPPESDSAADDVVKERPPGGAVGRRLVLIDFEMIGVGSPAQELGQFMISHTAPALRRASERELIADYHAEIAALLRAKGLDAEAEDFTLDACWAEYVAGGAARWMWFVAAMVTWGLPPKAHQFFHDQLAGFLRDHVPDPAKCEMPRV